ncbi:MAG TPA: xanthine dehydrogenase family protein molybdopterin-binding subunit [Leptolyngbyaceae cyanobacterium M33_DOE_097]|uniref:Xanthine dehydrogenase family protein molybdopterin-binding subunit n=1 Tax=Oscillatoriales cyanobacterium SpSt-418 TaxID=2282169 RepID=A0A7C3KDS5_9CYAN|nr:xanthine dehydrogenase family protein molybdopterin-binding subunit [Leptolyngbyaceae cyanobacterium M33_DOE_097]
MKRVMGTSVSRKDGFAKVTGQATYTAEHPLPGLVHGYLVTSAIAKGRIKSISTQKAEQAPGVLAVVTHKNRPKVFTPANDFRNSKLNEARLPLSDDQIHYGGQIVAFVVAHTLEQARDAAHLITVEYDIQTPLLEAQQAIYEALPDVKFNKGNGATGTTEAAITVEATYTTAKELHAAMEPHAIIAHWQADSLTIYEGSQWVMLHQRTYAELFGIPSEKVRLVTPYIGGAFGSKCFPWSYSILCAAVAREIKRPLKLSVTRRQLTTNTGHRAATEQTLRLAAMQDGKLIAISHAVKTYTSPADRFIVDCTATTPVMYAAPNIRLQQKLGVLNVATPTYMRAPSENPGMWALESAMDELAWKLNIDPIDLRLDNETRAHQRSGLPFSAKHFAECLRVGAEKFGWRDRPKQPRSLIHNGQLLGWGMAAATFPAMRGNTTVKVRLLPDGTVHVLTAGNDMGTGAYTMVAITAAEALGVPVEKVKVELGDSLFPDGGLAGGSQMTASLAPAVLKACEEVLQKANCTTANDACAALKQSGRAAFEAIATSAPGEDAQKWAFQSWGAHFCEVAVDEAIGRIRVTRWVSVMDIGRVMNAKAAASQVRGSVIMGIGEALMEECQLDPNSGYPVVYDLATYHYPTHADTPRIDVTFVGQPDLTFNPLGVRGVGEVGITGVAAAVANAIYHATGKRFRNLPITPDKLMA